MDKNKETVSRDQFFADIMQGFEEASQFARGQAQLRVTHVEIEGAEPAVTKVKVGSTQVKSIGNSMPATSATDGPEMQRSTTRSASKPNKKISK